MPNRLTTFWSTLMTTPRRVARGQRVFRSTARLHAPLDIVQMPALGEFAFPSLFARATRSRDSLIVGVKPLNDLAWPWCKVIAALELCDADSDQQDAAGYSQARATLHPGAVTLGGVPVVELRSIDDGECRQWHYVLGFSYLRARASLRTLIEQRGDDGSHARMQENPCGQGGLYLPTEAGGLWLHADPDDASRAHLVCVRMR